MTLQEYMRKHRLTDQVVADAIGVDRTAVCRWRSGNQCPTLRAAVAVEKYTGGKVRPSTFIDALEAA